VKYSAIFSFIYLLHFFFFVKYTNQTNISLNEYLTVPLFSDNIELTVVMCGLQENLAWKGWMLFAESFQEELNPTEFPRSVAETEWVEGVCLKGNNIL